jgi:membrane fusion protein, multidrug efflux system
MGVPPQDPATPERIRMQTSVPTILRWLTVLPLAAAIGCPRPPGARPEPPPAPVLVATAGTRTVPVQVHAIGSVKATATVAVRSRVGGTLTEVHFKEGDFVKKGQPLFTVDPRPYQTAVRQAEATLARDTALLRGAEIAVRRIEQGGGTGAITANELDIARTAVASARATVEADEAALASAKIQVGFTTITSPLDGRAGELLVNAGNLIDANGTAPLVVVNQLTPIYVTFALPEQQFPAVAAAQRAAPLRVGADIRGGEAPVAGTLAFIDNAVTTESGTVQLKAMFPNADLSLWPGQFVDVVLTVRERPNSVVIPAAAVQAGQQGTYVYVVTANQTAELRPVAIAFDADGQSVVESGLKGGETVVVEGQLRLTNGTRVDPKPAPARPSPARPATPVPTVVTGGGQ